MCCVDGVDSTALLKARRRAQRKEEKAALAAKAKADGTVTEEKKPVKKTGAYRPWAAIRAEQQAAQRQGKPPKIDDEASFPSLGGGATYVTCRRNVCFLL